MATLRISVKEAVARGWIPAPAPPAPLPTPAPDWLVVPPVQFVIKRRARDITVAIVAIAAWLVGFTMGLMAVR
jgi:hypothetical protein